MDIMAIPFPRRMKKKLNARSFVLPEDLFLEGWIVPSGTEVKVWQSENFGWVMVPDGTRDKRGFLLPRRLFRY